MNRLELGLFSRLKFKLMVFVFGLSLELGLRFIVKVEIYTMVRIFVSYIVRFSIVHRLEI